MQSRAVAYCRLPTSARREPSMGVVGLCGVHRADATAGNDVLDGLSGRQGSTVSGPGGRRSTDRVRCVKEADTETRQRHRSAGRSPNAACVVPGRATARADDLLVADRPRQHEGPGRAVRPRRAATSRPLAIPAFHRGPGKGRPGRRLRSDMAYGCRLQHGPLRPGLDHRPDAGRCAYQSSQAGGGTA